MRTAKHWRFFGDRQALTKEEVIYWSRVLPKLLKLGVELEFNLPKQEGGCKGNNPSCDCAKMKDVCAQSCARNDECRLLKSTKDCINANSPICPGNCGECNNFLLTCPGIYCVDFISKCVSCNDYVTDCKSCPQKFVETKDPASIRRKLSSILSPTNNWGMPGKNCIAQVTEDGSLKGDKGVEVTTVGRRLDYKSFYEMVKMITDNVLEAGGYVDERTSIHIHCLAAYYRRFKKDADKTVNISELEKSIPEVVLANLHQLFRRYQNTLTWMGMGLDSPETMTRWGKFRVSILEHSAYLNSMEMVRDKIRNECQELSGQQHGDYGFINYDNCRFDDNGDVRRFHIEFRSMDNIPCPSIITAMACLMHALVLKAVELSRYGLLEVGDNEWLKLSRAMKESILNNCPKDWADNRFGDTSQTMKYARHFREQGMEMLNLVKNGLMDFGPQVYEQLVRLVEKPVALRRIETGKTWKEIEADFFIPLREEEEISSNIKKIVDLRMMLECKTPEEWVKSVFAEFNNEFRDMSLEAFEDHIKAFITKGALTWSESLGTFI